MRKSMLLSCLLLSLTGRASAAPQDKDAPANARARMEAAQKVYKGLLARWKVDPNLPDPFERLHRWSSRWMEAQAEPGTKKDQIAAAEAHLARMRELEKEARKLLQEKFIAPHEVSATEFYRLDAEKHLRAVKKK
jgi:hypothetical protein